MSIEISGVTVGYGRNRPILENVDLRIETGSITALIGPNGCGKSTLLKTIARLLKPSRGRVVVDGLDVTATPPKQVARTIAYLPQSPIVPEAITVEQLVAYGRAPHQSLLGIRSAADSEMIEHAIAVTGLGPLRERLVADLSGGQRQRAFIAMVLAQDTPYVMLDEPTTFLDIRHQVETLGLVRDLHAMGRTSVVVLHDIGQAARYGDQVVVMQEGRVRMHGAPAEVVSPGLINEVYGLDCVVYPDPVSGTPAIAPR